MTTNITYTKLKNGRWEARFTLQNTMIGFYGVTVWCEYYNTLSELKFNHPTAQPKK